MSPAAVLNPGYSTARLAWTCSQPDMLVSIAASPQPFALRLCLDMKISVGRSDELRVLVSGDCVLWQGHWSATKSSTNRQYIAGCLPHRDKHCTPRLIAFRARMNGSRRFCKPIKIMTTLPSLPIIVETSSDWYTKSTKSVIGNRTKRMGTHPIWHFRRNHCYQSRHFDWHSGWW